MREAITSTVSALAALAMQWAGECLQAVPAPDEARLLVEAGAQLTATEPDLKAVLALAPLLDLNAYRRATEAGVLDVDWLSSRHPDADSARRLDLDLATAAFFASMDDAVSPFSASASDAFSAASGWAVGRASMLEFDGNRETSGLARLVVGVGDATAALGLHAIDDLVEAVFDVLGCAQQRSARIAIARLATSWEASVEDLVEMAPRLLLDPTADHTDPVQDSWSEHWAQLHPSYQEQSIGVTRTTTSDWPKVAFSVLIRWDHATKDDWYNDSLIICRLVLRWGIEYFTAVGVSAEATSVYRRALVAIEFSDDDLGPYLDANPDLLTHIWLARCWRGPQHEGGPAGTS